MKKLIAVLLCFAMVMGLAACGSEEKTEKDNGSSDVKIEDTGKDTPSEDLVIADLKEALLEKNEYAVLTSAETIKSLSGEGSYDITLAVSAESKYADWTYEVDLAYTKYDQGWMIDDANWTSEAFTQVRIPEVSTMVEYASEYLPSHVPTEEYMFPIDNAVVEYGYCSVPGQDALTFSWNTTHKGNFGTNIFPYTSYWEYNAEIDNWTLLPNPEPGSGGYYLESETLQVEPVENLDFTGSWDDHLEAYGVEIPMNITITNYSPDGFDATIQSTPYDTIEMEFMEKQTVTAHFTRVPDDYAMELTPIPNRWMFTDGENNFLMFLYGDDSMNISYFADGTRTGICVEIETQLPTLP